MIEMKKCPKCGIEFEKKSKSDCYCRECKNKIQNQKRMEKIKKKFEGAPPSTFVVCKICGLVSENISAHLRRAHNLSSEEYKKQFPGEEVMSQKMREEFSERITGAKNPGFQHGGKLSPFSEKFIGGNVKKETIEKLKKSRDENCSYTTRLDYYEKQGLSKEEAEKALKERQTTFSKEICIEKHGEEEGMKVWEARQKKWMISISNNEEGLKFLDDADLSKLLDSSEFNSYRNQIKKETLKTLELFREEIDPENLLAKEGYEIDHKLSRLQGFLNDISPKIMGCKHNIRVVTKEENFKKGGSSIISIEELNRLYLES